MKIEKVENGFIVEVDLDVQEIAWSSSTVIKCGTEKYICSDLEELLGFIGSHYKCE